MDGDADAPLAPAAPPGGSAHRIPLGVFPPPIIIPPLSQPHGMTVVFLHGRGSNARKFHAPLLSSPIAATASSSSLSFRQALPNARFVFPTAAMMRATKYRRMLIHQWYDGSGDWEPDARGEMRPAVEHVRGLLRDEVSLLDGDARRVVVAGISQGCAMALMSLLLWEGEALGAAVGMCGFVPLNESLSATLEEEEGDDVFERDGDEDRSALQRAVDDLREEAELPPSPARSSPFPFSSTPVFLGHGTEDVKVECRHGQKAAELLGKMGMSVEFRAYEGLGHWYSPQMLGDIVAFLQDKVKL